MSYDKIDRKLIDAWDIPPWLVPATGVQRTPYQRLRWKLRYVRRLKRRALFQLDKELPRVGLMRVSQQPVKELAISEGRLSVTLRNGFRWSGQQDGYHLKKTTIPPNPIGYGDT